MKKHLLTSALALATLTGASNAASLSLDIQPTGGLTAAGWQAFEATNQDAGQAAGGVSTVYAEFGTNITVTLTASNLPDTPLDWRAVARNGDDGATNPNNDWFGLDTRNAGVDVTMTLTIAGLPTGQYNWLSGHHDGGVDTGGASNGNLDGRADYTFTDAGGSNSLADGITFTRQDQGDTPWFFSYDFTSDGSDVVVDFVMDNGQGPVSDTNSLFVLANSLVITEIPEPSAGILAGLGLLGLLRRRR